MRALITGANGTLGKALSQHLAQQNIEVVAWDRQAVPIDHYQSMEDFVRQTKPDMLFHLATSSQPTGRPNEDWLVNYEWTSELAWICRQLDVRFIFTSSVMVFTDDAKGPFTPKSVPDAKEGYGYQKLQAEQRSLSQNPNAIVARIGWQIGENRGGNHMLDYLERQMAEGVYVAIMGVVNEGDEVILIEPYFDTYLPIVEAAGGKPVFVPMHPPAWTFDPAELRAAFNEKTAAIVINTPHNPTGRVYSLEEMTLIADLCKEFDVVVISDEVYEHLVFDGARHIPMATLPNMFERSLTVSSGAKTFSATGWKIGWVMGHPELVEGPWRIHQSVTFAVNHPAQFGIAKGLSLGNSYYEELQAIYSRKREILRQGLVAGGIKVDYAPDGAFFIMGDFSEVFDGDDREFAKWLIREFGVACIPPSAFFSPAHRHITRNHARFAYCKNDEVLYKAAERLAKLKG